jgi:glutamate racemase
MVGFYDTGKGGRSIIDAVLDLDPQFSYQLYEDLSSLPLGEKSHIFILERVKFACERLFETGVKLIILACNTASVHTIRYLQTEWLPANYPDRQILSITVPLLEYVDLYYNHLHEQAGILLATPATCKHPYYIQEFKKRGFTNIVAQPMQGLADAIEYADEQKIIMLLKRLQRTIETTPRYIILACTHYTYIQDIIQVYFPHAAIIDSKGFTAEQILNYCARHPEYTSTPKL